MLELTTHVWACNIRRGEPARRGELRTSNPGSGRQKNLHPGTPYFKSSALSHSATLLIDNSLQIPYKFLTNSLQFLTNSFISSRVNDLPQNFFSLNGFNRRAYFVTLRLQFSRALLLMWLSARTRIAKTKMSSIERSFYLFKTRTFCAIFLYH